MNATLRNSLAVLALAVATPAGAWAVYPDVDFEWYANVGAGRGSVASINTYPAPRAGYIWSPAHYEWDGGPHQIFVPGAWIVDDYDAQWRHYAFGDNIVVASGRPKD